MKAAHGRDRHFSNPASRRFVDSDNSANSDMFRECDISMKRPPDKSDTSTNRDPASTKPSTRRFDKPRSGRLKPIKKSFQQTAGRQSRLFDKNRSSDRIRCSSEHESINSTKSAANPLFQRIRRFDNIPTPSQRGSQADKNISSHQR